jgi:hypothetical protein
MSENEFLRGKPTDVSGEQALSFLFKIITLFIITCGLQAAAQKFAFSVGYESGWIGRPSGVVHIFKRDVPVYPFWNLFIWTLKFYKRTEIHAMLYAAWRIALYTSVSADKIAAQLGVSPAVVYRYKALMKAGDAVMIERVRRGELSVGKALKALKNNGDTPRSETTEALTENSAN